jgi:hypothetical protein
MAFRGVYDAPEIKPTSCGLLSVARVMTHTSRAYDERWIRGFSYIYDTEGTLRLLTTDDDTITGGELFDGEGLDRYKDYEPFFIEVEDFSSTFGLLGVDRIAKIKKQLEAGTQKAVERELWDGLAATAASNANTFLASTDADVVSSDANEAYLALFLLEQAISDSPLGEQGYIHMTRDVASFLGSRLTFGKDTDNKFFVQTRLGTPVIIGSGYTGTGPEDSSNTEPSDSNKWMYATGPVDVHLGKIEVVNENLGQGVDASINSMRLKVTRPAAAYFDPSMHYAVRVSLPTT